MATSPSPSNLGKKPKWHLTDEELLRLPSRICGMAADTELKCRREAACFIQDMADWLNHNVQNRGRIDQNCICIAMLHMHRFYLVHSFTVFPPKDVAAASLFLAGKSEESPRKLEHIVEVWFKLKYKGADVQPPFNDTVKKNGAELIVYLESILLQTIGFELHVQLPHPVVINKMQKFKLEGISEDQKLVELAYWFATDIIQYTNWCIRFNEKAIACVCIYLAYIWAGHEIPETAGAPWFKSIDPEMTEELLIKLTEEFTLIYTNCNYCHAYKFIEKVKKNGNPATMPAKVIAQLPPPPPPPVMGQMQPVKSEPPSVDQQKRPAAARPAPVAADGTLPRPLKRSPKSEPSDNNSSNMVASKRPAMATANPNSRADGLSSEKNATTAVNSQQPNDQIRMPLPPVKLEPISSPVSSTATPKSLASDEPPGVAVTINKKKIGLSEYKQRLNKIKSEPAASDSPASQATPTNSQSIQSIGEIKLEMNCGGADNNNGTPSAAAATTDGAEKKDKRQSFMPDLSNASSSTLGATALELPIGIPLVEKTKKPQRHDSIDREKQLQHAAAMATAHRSAEDHKRTNNNNSSSASSTHRSHHHREHHHNSSGGERSHSQHEHHKQHHKSHHRDKERDSTRIYLNGSISSSSSSAEKPHHKSSSRERERGGGAIMVTGNASSAEEQHRHRLLLQQKLKSEKRLTPPPPPPPPVNRLSPTNGQPPPPPPAAAADGNGHQQQQHQELEEGELL